MPAPLRSRKILFVHPDPIDFITPFIKQDSLFLQQWYTVEELSLYPFKHFYQDVLRSPAVWRAVARHDAVFCWFGSCTPVVIIATLLKKPSVIVAGGADVVSVPEVKYGLDRRDKLRLYLWTLGYKLAQRVLLFSESSRQELLKLPGMPTKRAETLYLGIDTKYFKPQGQKKQRALTISYISENNLRRKGLQTFIEAAHLTPHVQFRLGGKVIEEDAVEKINLLAPTNVNFLGFLDDQQLRSEYQQASVYAQLSFHEGFGVALAEAMACECVPLVTNRGSIPEVVGDTGIYVPVEDPAATSEAIQQILSTQDNKQGQRARQRIIELFPMSNREKGLKAVMEAVLL